MKIKHGTIGDGPVLDDFGEAAQDLPDRQAFEQRHVADDKIGLIEHPDHILVPTEIDTVFAPHAGIHLRQQCGRDKTEAHPPHVGGGHESGNIADDAATDAQQERWTGPPPGQPVG
jgi:hypothetical protein